MFKIYKLREEKKTPTDPKEDIILIEEYIGNNNQTIIGCVINDCEYSGYSGYWDRRSFIEITEEANVKLNIDDFNHITQTLNISKPKRNRGCIVDFKNQKLIPLPPMDYDPYQNYPYPKKEFILKFKPKTN